MHQLFNCIVDHLRTLLYGVVYLHWLYPQFVNSCGVVKCHSSYWLRKCTISAKDAEVLALPQIIFISITSEWYYYDYMKVTWSEGEWVKECTTTTRACHMHQDYTIHTRRYHRCYCLNLLNVTLLNCKVALKNEMTILYYHIKN